MKNQPQSQQLPAPLPDLPPSLARRCRDCNRPFETRDYGNERCVRCSLIRLQAVSAYNDHDSAWEDRQRAFLAEQLRLVAEATARDAQKRQAVRALMIFVGIGSAVFGLLRALGH